MRTVLCWIPCPSGRSWGNGTWRSTVSHILTCSEENTSKREPTIYLRATQEIGTLPKETAVFEDVLYGIQAAKRAEFITVAVEDSSNRSEREQLSHTADYFIRDFTDPILRTI